MSSTLGSPTKTCWKRRSRAGSFSIRSRYSSSVVAPIRCSSPRASIGLSMLPASIAESPPAPAPTTVCSSSMKVMIWPSAPLISSSTALSRSSNSPRYFAPATIAARSRLSTRRPLSESGTSPATTRWASPSTTAVLPTPGSPISTGLFLVRRDSTWTTRRISASRPMTGSSLPSSARAVRSTAYFSEGLVGRLGLLAGHPAVAAHGGDRLAQRRLGRRRPRRAASAPGCRPRPGRAAGARWRRSRPSSRRSARATSPAPGSARPRRRGSARSSPEALGRFRSAWSSAWLTAATSAPALASREGVMPCSWRSSATARCTGSTWGLPSLTARVLAALITSTLREVSLDASTVVLLEGLGLVGPVLSATSAKLSPFPSTLARLDRVPETTPRSAHAADGRPP